MKLMVVARAYIGLDWQNFIYLFIYAKGLQVTGACSPKKNKMIHKYLVQVFDS